MTKPLPNLLRIDDRVRPGDLLHRETRVQVNVHLLIRLIRQLTAIERLFCLRVEEIQVIGLSDLRETIRANFLAHFILFFLAKSKRIQQRNDSVKGIKQQSALNRHAFGIPTPVRHIECDHTARTGFNTASIWTNVNRYVVHVARHQPTDEPPELTRQNIRLAVHRADDIARLDGYAFDLICVNHFRSVLIIRIISYFVSPENLSDAQYTPTRPVRLVHAALPANLRKHSHPIQDDSSTTLQRSAK